MNNSLPFRPLNNQDVDYDGAGPKNSNLGPGRQTNNTIGGGTNARQFIADTINYTYAQCKETPPLPTHTLPFLRDPDFVERQEFSDLEHRISQTGSRVAVIGLGGIGKSQLAIEYCYRLREQSPDTWVLWIHSSSATRFDQDVRKLVDDVQIPGRKEKDVNIFQLVHSWLLDTRNKWFIILDNADDADFMFEAPQAPGATDVGTRPRIDYLPVCSHGSILITTRRQSMALRLVDRCNLITLNPNKIHAKALLCHKLGILSEDPSIDDLTAALEYMPLAIAQAAAYIISKAPRCTVEEYMRSLQRSDKSKSKLLQLQSYELRRDRMEAKNSILLTWQVSFEHIYRTRRSAADMLFLMSFFDCQGISESLLRPDRISARKEHVSEIVTDAVDDHSKSDDADGSSADSINDAFELDIGILRDFLFISPTSDPAVFQMHHLVQLAAQAWLRANAHFDHWELQSLSRLNSVFPYPEYDKWAECFSYYPHVTKLLRSKLVQQDTLLLLASVFYKGAWFACAQGLYLEGEKLIRRSIDIHETVLGKKHASYLTSLAVLASLYIAKGLWKDAEELASRILETRTAIFGVEHPDTLNSMRDLAWIYLRRGRLEDSIETGLKVIAMESRVFGKKHPFTLSSMTVLAASYRESGRLKEAEDTCQEVFQVRCEVLGSKHPDTLNNMANLVQIYMDQGRYRDAEKLGLSTMDAIREVLGDDHPDTLTSTENLAGVYKAQGRLEESETLQYRVVEKRTEMLGSDHPDTLTSTENLAWVYKAQGRLKESETLQYRVVEKRTEMLGSDHPYTFTSMSNLGGLYWDQGQLEDAERMQRTTMETMTKVLGEEHPDTLININNLAATYYAREKFGQAGELYKKLMNVQRSKVGQDHPGTLSSTHNLANTYRNQERWSEAEELCKVALERRRKVLGEEHPDTLTSMNCMAWILKGQGKLVQARTMMAQCVTLRKQVLGGTHPHSLASIIHLKAWDDEAEASGGPRR